MYLAPLALHLATDVHLVLRHTVCAVALRADRGSCPSDPGTVPNLIFVDPLGIAQGSFSNAFDYYGLQALSNTTLTISPQSGSGSGFGSQNPGSSVITMTTGSGNTQTVYSASTGGLPVGFSTSSLLVQVMGSSYSSTLVGNNPPTIHLLTTSLLGIAVMVRQGTPYQACSPGQEPTSTSPCELGVSASTARGGSLTSSVLVCPPATCMSPSVCPASAFALNGITACAVNTSAPVGTVTTIKFVVYDSSASPPLSASISLGFFIGS